MRELTAMGDGIRSYLEDALEQKPTLEMRRRVEAILEKLPHREPLPPLSPSAFLQCQRPKQVRTTSEIVVSRQPTRDLECNFRERQSVLGPFVGQLTRVPGEHANGT